MALPRERAVLRQPLGQLAADHARAADDENFHAASFVIPGLVPGIQLSIGAAAGDLVGPGDKRRDDTYPSFTPQAAAQARPSTVPRRGLYSQPTQPWCSRWHRSAAAASVVQVARVGLAAVGRVGDLVVAGEGRVLLEGDGHVAVLDLAVVEVELQAEVGLAHLVDDGAGLGELVEEVAGDVAAVDRLDHQVTPAPAALRAAFLRLATNVSRRAP